ncbi:2-amino-3-carboxymuconate-6-semialdehyde decarboxylase [Liparis tanakae]|uniref:2-amino-3-carboxymuconate-6-semialdehyde decarboxylase n=1 Tax=Liparis tanakae TaxID=230148 RepID=A0A4Z2GGM5_9TELE|nr:2-amino-3-carboxymuconate-6-semialdehyde decarboxylase [Liparis tanakae]
MQTDGRMAKYWLPWLVGGSFPFTVGRIEHGHKVRPDLCAVDNQASPRKYLGSFYTDSLVHDPVALKLLVDVIGKDKVMLGTDYPFPLGELQPGSLIESMDEFDDTLKKSWFPVRRRRHIRFLDAECWSAMAACRGSSSKWFFTREQLETTPSRRCGVEPDRELSYRQQAANLVQDMGQRLNVYPL